VDPYSPPFKALLYVSFFPTSSFFVLFGFSLARVLALCFLLKSSLPGTSHPLPALFRIPPICKLKRFTFFPLAFFAFCAIAPWLSPPKGFSTPSQGECCSPPQFLEKDLSPFLLHCWGLRCFPLPFSKGLLTPLAPDSARLFCLVSALDAINF